MIMKFRKTVTMIIFVSIVTLNGFAGESFIKYEKMISSPVTYLFYRINSNPIKEEKGENKRNKAPRRQDLSFLPCTWLSGNELNFKCQVDYQVVDVQLKNADGEVVMITTLLMQKDQQKALSLTSLSDGAYTLCIIVDNSEAEYFVDFLLSEEE